MLRKTLKVVTSALAVGLLLMPQTQNTARADFEVSTPIFEITPAQLTLEPIEDVDLDPVSEADEQPVAPQPVDCGVDKCVALTFDDGPHRNTLKILASLEKQGAKATFFAVGTQVKSHPEIAAKIVAEGHEIAGHSFRHQRLNRLSEGELRSDFGMVSKVIEQATGNKPKLFRPPYGISTARIREFAELPTVMWSVDPQDWRTRSSKATVRQVLENIHPGAIVVLHDPLTSTANAVPVLVSELRKRGYQLVTVSELLADAKPGESYQKGQVPSGK